MNTEASQGQFCKRNLLTKFFYFIPTTIFRILCPAKFNFCTWNFDEIILNWIQSVNEKLWLRQCSFLNTHVPNLSLVQHISVDLYSVQDEPSLKPVRHHTNHFYHFEILCCLMYPHVALATSHQAITVRQPVFGNTFFKFTSLQIVFKFNFQLF